MKTTLASVAYPVWRLLQNPDLRILVTSATEKMSSKIIDNIKTVFESSKFKAKYGDHTDGRKWKGKEIVVSSRRHKTLRDPSVAVASVETSEVGGHWDLIIPDDLHDEKNVSSREMIDKVKKHFALLTPLLEPDGEIEVIGTKWDEADVYSFIETCIPKECFSLKKAIADDGTNLFPEKYTKEFLADAKFKMGSYLYNLNYQNTATSPEDMVFKTEWLKRCLWHEPSFPLMESYYITVDPAISEARNADYSALVVCGVDRNDVWYIVEAINAHLSPTEIINKTFELADRWKPVKVGIEVVAYQKVLKNWVEREMQHRSSYFLVDELKPGQRSKAKRIEGLFARVENAALRWRPGYDLITDQFRRHRPDREQSHDDLIDALAYMPDVIPPVVIKGDRMTSGHDSARKYSRVIYPGDGERTRKGWYGMNHNHYRRVGA